MPLSKAPWVLILGERSLAQVIATKCAQLGCRPLLWVDWVAEPTLFMNQQPQALYKVYESLKKFAEFSEASGFVHPGVTSLAERSLLALWVKDLGLKWIGPGNESLAYFENKLLFFFNAQTFSIPHLVRSFEPFSSFLELEEWVKKNFKEAFPLILKPAFYASLGCFLKINDLQEMRQWVPVWLEQLKKNFGESLFFVQGVPGLSRKIMIPIVRLMNGKTYVFPSLDYSLMNHFQKIIHFAPAHLEMSTEMHFRLVGWMQTLLEESNFVGLCCFEFLLQDEEAFLMGVNPRLNTEFHLWEKLSETCAISWQFSAMNLLSEKHFPKVLPQDHWSFALSFRVYAGTGFSMLPAPGWIESVSIPPFPRESSPPSFEATGDSLNSLLESEDVECFSHLENQQFILSSDLGSLAYVFIFSPERNRLFDLAKSFLKRFVLQGDLRTNLALIEAFFCHPFVSLGMDYSFQSFKEWGDIFSSKNDLKMNHYLLAEEGTFVTSPTSGQMGPQFFREGDLVVAGEQLSYVESFHRHIPLTVFERMKILQWLVAEGDFVKTGQSVLRVHFSSMKGLFSVINS